MFINYLIIGIFEEKNETEKNISNRKKVKIINI